MKNPEISNQLRWAVVVPLCAVLCTVSVLSGCAGKTRPETAAGAGVPAAASTGAAAGSSVPDGPAAVYLTRSITSDGLLAVYHALGRPAAGRVAVKLHFGEPGNRNHLSPELVRGITEEVNGTFVECNTYYGGRRTTTQAHLLAAEQHGFTYAPVEILDADGEIRLPITGGTHLDHATVGAGYGSYDFIVSIAHFKGHEMAGFGGTFKNIGMGMASKFGKSEIHDEPGMGKFSSRGDTFLEKIVECAKAVIDDRGEKILYVNVLNNLSIDCDCNSYPAPFTLADIGILASTDPVALEQASLDMIYAAPESERAQLVSRIERLNGVRQITYAEELGLGHRTYELVEIDG